MQRTGNENADEQGEDGGMAAALGDDDYTSAVDKERAQSRRPEGERI